MKSRIIKSALIGIFITLIVFSLAQAAPPSPGSLIEISANANDEMQPAVAHSTTSDTYLVAYEDDNHVKLRLYNSTGSPLFPAALDLASDAYWPSVTYNSLHNLFGVAYVYNHQDIIMCWVSVYNQNPISCSTVYSQVGETLMSTSIAFNNNDSNDDFMIVWQQGALGDWSIYGHRVTPTNPYSAIGSRIDIALATSPPTYDEAYSAPDITYNLNMNEYLVVFEYWISDPSHTSGYDIYGRLIRNDGSGPAPLPYLLIDTGDDDQTLPTVAAYRLNTTYPYFVAYQDDWFDTETSIRGIYLKQDGTLPNPFYYLNISANYQVREAHPDISVSEALGTYIITWAKDSGTNMDIYAVYLDVNQLIAFNDPPILISGTAQNARNDETYPAVAAGTTGSMIAWQEDGWTGTSSDVIGAIWGYVAYLPLILK